MQVIFAVESHMSHLAELAGIDRVEFRRRNVKLEAFNRAADRRRRFDPLQHLQTALSTPTRARNRRFGACSGERNVGHSIRPDFADGFLFPYQEALALAARSWIHSQGMGPRVARLMRSGHSRTNRLKSVASSGARPVA